jgi:DNA-binding transcriptional LysR family regulator
MEIRHLRYFCAVVRDQSFTRAAEKLAIAQPALSRQIQQLETELGALLIERDVRPLRITPLGKFVFDQSEQILAKIEEMERATRQMALQAGQYIGIGFVGSTMYGPLPGLIRRIAAASPDIKIVLTELTTIQQIDALKSGRIDVGFGRLDIEDPMIVREVLVSEPLVVAVSSAHPFARRDEVSLAEVAQQPFIIYPSRPRPSYADQVIEVFRKAGLSLKIVQETNEVQAAIGLVAAGIGVTVVPEAVERLNRSDITYVDLMEPKPTSPIIMSTRSGPASPILRRFLDLVHTKA